MDTLQDLRHQVESDNLQIGQYSNEVNELQTRLKRLQDDLSLMVSQGVGVDLTPTSLGTVTQRQMYDYIKTLDDAWRDRVMLQLGKSLMPAAGE